jgi:hypothetical protein
MAGTPALLRRFGGRRLVCEGADPFSSYEEEYVRQHGGLGQKPKVLIRTPAGISTWMLVLASTLAACSGSGDESGAPAEAAEAGEPRFPGSTRTLDGLGRTVLVALAASDTTTLAALRLTEQEHNEVVWPELPASRPEVNFPIDFAWTNIELRDRRSITRLLPIFGGLEVGFLTVQCRGGTQTFETFHVLTDCWTIFELEGREGPFEAQLFKDVLVRSSGHKIFRYYDGLPRRLGSGRSS